MALSACCSFKLPHLPLAVNGRSLRSSPRCVLSSPSSSAPLALSAFGSFDAIIHVADPTVRRCLSVKALSGYNVQIVVAEEESEEALLRRFRREVMKAGVIQECKRRRFFENRQEEKKRKAREAGRRNRRRRFGPRTPPPQLSSTSTPQNNGGESQKREEDAGDNWDLPLGGLPL